METSYPVANEPLGGARSAVSWAAILAGTAVAAATTLILLALGSGLGFAAASPWPSEGATAATVGVLAGIWLIVTQWVSAGLGGYLAGRMRTRWAGTHAHEVFFRDTAHGFLTWAVASLVVAIVVASASSAVVGTAVDAGATVAAGAANGAAQGAGNAMQNGTTLSGYNVDTLFRSAQPAPGPQSNDQKAEASRILTKGLVAGEIPDADRTYLATQIAASTGITQDEAQKRVDEVVATVQAADTKAREAADAARKAAATTAILTALSMLVGAFIACVAAALGGRERDLHP